ncbi:MAG: hypothetical protein M1330_02010 [Armatimonadetes bacterium]|nr:hypothetical protein [Armatimonadota bacterium]
MADEPVYRTKGIVEAANGDKGDHWIYLTPFYAAGQDGSRYEVWLGTPRMPVPRAAALISGSIETASRDGNVMGSITDCDPATFRVTYNGARMKYDWFAISLKHPLTISWVRYVQGKTFHDGGWFDASQGSPKFRPALSRMAHG